MKTKQLVTMQAAKSVDLKTRTVDAWISTSQVDRDGEIVRSKAFTKRIESFKANPVVLFMHNPCEVPVGKVLDLDFREDRVGAQIQFRDTERGNDIAKAYADGSLTSFSIGFRVFEVRKSMNDDGRPAPPEIVDAELYEVSAVTIPANPGARVKASSAGVVLDEAARVIDLVEEMRASGEAVDESLLELVAGLRRKLLSPRRGGVTRDQLDAVLATWRTA